MKSRSNAASCATAYDAATRVWCVGPAILMAVASSSSADIIDIPAHQPTIQAGIEAAVDGDDVVVAPGTYPENVNFNGKAITVRSVDPNDPAVVASTIIDAGGSGSVVTCTSDERPDTTLWGLTLTGGTGTYDDVVGVSAGGGMYIVGSSPTVINCIFTDNTAEIGGGMYNDFGSPTVTDSTFSGNWVCGAGGGMFDGAGATVTNCTFTDNAAFQGGGLYGGNVVTNCTFSGNTASEGGGIGTCGTVINCVFTDNWADYGGGMHGCGTLTDCTFSGNLAANGRAVALIDTWPWPPVDLTLANCILWDGGDEIWAVYGTVTVSYSNVQGSFPGAGNIDVDPRFVDRAGGDLRLQPGSPCIDAGDNLAVPAGIITDLEGNPRFAHDSCTLDTGRPDGTNPPVDMGAYEYQPACPADLGCSGGVDFGDLLAILAAWGSCAGCPEDLDNDDAVGFGELLVVLSSWGRCP
ncbi:MAG: hypothetical protein GY715_01455 [Planctomycetes bacterium]|nr:hypothetical protein [Planctomycetota bacterium]